MFGLFELSDALTTDQGYPAILSRMAITARTPAPAIKAGNQFLGLIPKSLKVPKIGWVSDIISWRDNSAKMTQDEIDLVSADILTYFLVPSETTEQMPYHFDVFKDVLKTHCDHWDFALGDD